MNSCQRWCAALCFAIIAICADGQNSNAADPLRLLIDAVTEEEIDAYYAEHGHKLQKGLEKARGRAFVRQLIRQNIASEKMQELARKERSGQAWRSSLPLLIDELGALLQTESALPPANTKDVNSIYDLQGHEIWRIWTSPPLDSWQGKINSQYSTRGQKYRTTDDDVSWTVVVKGVSEQQSYPRPQKVVTADLEKVHPKTEAGRSIVQEGEVMVRLRGNQDARLLAPGKRIVISGLLPVPNAAYPLIGIAVRHGVSENSGKHKISIFVTNGSFEVIE